MFEEQDTRQSETTLKLAIRRAESAAHDWFGANGGGEVSGLFGAAYAAKSKYVKEETNKILNAIEAHLATSKRPLEQPRTPRTPRVLGADTKQDLVPARSDTRGPPEQVPWRRRDEVELTETDDDMPNEIARSLQGGPVREERASNDDKVTLSRSEVQDMIAAALKRARNNAPAPAMARTSQQETVTVSKQELQDMIAAAVGGRDGQDAKTPKGATDEMAKALTKLSRRLKHKQPGSDSDSDSSSSSSSDSDVDDLERIPLSVRVWRKRQLLSNPIAAHNLTEVLFTKYVAGRTSHVKGCYDALVSLIKAHAEANARTISKRAMRDLRQGLWELRAAHEAEVRYPTSLALRKVAQQQLLTTFKKKYDKDADPFEKALAGLNLKGGGSDFVGGKGKRAKKRGCYNCGSTDHLAAACKSAPKNGQGAPASGAQNYPKRPMPLG